MSVNLPYVISDDISLLSRTFEKVSAVTCPSESFCIDSARALRVLMERIFPYVDIVSGAEMGDFLRSSEQKSPLPVVSLVDIGLSRPELSIRVSRGVNENLNSLGMIPRNSNAPSLEQQIEEVSAYLKSIGEKDIALADDVVFSGSSLLSISKLFAQQGLCVRRVLTAIAIEEGKNLLKYQGIEVACGRYYRSVIDEVCARDLLPGMYGGGRTCRIKNGEYRSIPYLQSYGGLAAIWASIPDEAVNMHAVGCEDVGRAYWQETYRLTGRVITDQETGRPLLKGSIVTLQQGIKP